MIEPPKTKEDCRLLHRKVKELCGGVNSIMNMTAIMEGKTKGIGQLEMRGKQSFLRIYTSPGGFGPTIPTSVQLSSSKNPSSPGDSVTWTAVVVPTISVQVKATGTIQFYIDGAAFGSPVTLVQGQATSGVNTTMTIGSHSIGAHYSGDADFFPSDAPNLTQTVKYVTSLALSASLNPVQVTDSVHFTATLSGTNIANATGTIQFYIDGSPFGAAVAVSNGVAISGSTSWSSGGSHNIDAHYSGDSQYFSSDATTLSENVIVLVLDHFTLLGPIAINSGLYYGYEIQAQDASGQVVKNINLTAQIQFTTGGADSNLVTLYVNGVITHIPFGADQYAYLSMVNGSARFSAAGIYDKHSLGTFWTCTMFSVNLSNGGFTVNIDVYSN